MSDNSKFINAYIENAMGMIQEYVAVVLQTKAQLKVSEDIIAEKDQYVKVLLEEVEKAKTELSNNKTDLSSLNEKINEVNHLRGQLEHMNTFANQVNEMKQMLKDKETEIQKLNTEIEKLKAKPEPKSPKPAPKKDINKKESEKLAEPVEKVVAMIKPEEEQADDF